MEIPPGPTSRGTTPLGAADLAASAAASAPSTLGFLVVFDIRVNKYRDRFEPSGDAASPTLRIARLLVAPGAIAACTTGAGAIVVVIVIDLDVITRTATR